ncbi:Flp family type IVb pilin [Nocardioides cavernaquae]|uniref:Flp family type IVb pilin n=2 Tax=Nocardioides cavernaquae TaxID=2321396 RepID=A0A3A5HI00_9ACTN|nr:Flp family type IVb pilin [Nocardioides cavernaquae]
MLAVTTPRDEEEGATAVEYGLLVALIAAVIIVTVVALGTKIDEAFGSINSKL